MNCVSSIESRALGSLDLDPLLQHSRDVQREAKRSFRRIAADLVRIVAASRLAKAASLAAVFRKHSSPVIYVRVDLANMLQVPADRSHGDPRNPPPAIASELVPASGVQAGDLVVTKRHWSAFSGTDLEERLKLAGVKTVVSQPPGPLRAWALELCSLKTRRPALAQKHISSRSRRYFPCWDAFERLPRSLKLLLEVFTRATRPASRAEEWPSSRRLGQSGQTSQPLCGSMSGLFELREEV